MSAVEDPMRELEGIWLATIRAQRRRRAEIAFSVAAAVVTGFFLALGLSQLHSGLVSF